MASPSASPPPPPPVPWPRSPLKSVSEVNNRAHLIRFLFVRNHCPPTVWYPVSWKPFSHVFCVWPLFLNLSGGRVNPIPVTPWWLDMDVLISKKNHFQGFPSGSVVKNLPANAGDTGSVPDPGRFPHATEQLSPWATTSETVLWSLCSTTKKLPQWEAHAPQLESGRVASTCSTRESPPSNDDPAQPKTTNNKIIKNSFTGLWLWSSVFSLLILKFIFSFPLQTPDLTLLSLRWWSVVVKSSDF